MSSKSNKQFTVFVKDIWLEDDNGIGAATWAVPGIEFEPAYEWYETFVLEGNEYTIRVIFDITPHCTRKNAILIAKTFVQKHKQGMGIMGNFRSTSAPQRGR